MTRKIPVHVFDIRREEDIPTLKPMYGDEIRSLRRAAGLTRSDLAYLMKLGKGGNATIGHWERGTKFISAPYAELLRRICEEYRDYH